MGGPLVLGTAGGAGGVLSSRPSPRGGGSLTSEVRLRLRKPTGADFGSRLSHFQSFTISDICRVSFDFTSYRRTRTSTATHRRPCGLAVSYTRSEYGGSRPGESGCPFAARSSGFASNESTFV